MKDARGRKLEIGHTVVYSTVGYTDVYIGEVTRFTPKKVEITDPWQNKIIKNSDKLLIFKL